MSPRDPSARLPGLLRRGLAKRCPRCGAGSVFRSWWEMEESCPGCGLVFEREPGYWVGAMIVNTTVTFALFLVVLVGGAVLLWPEVPWTALLVATLVVMLVVPLAFYPRSKTVWLAVEMSYHQLEPAEREEAARRAARRPTSP